jgi:hypothetical protein
MGMKYTNTITAAANNGAGLIRITSVAHGLATNDIIRVVDVGGVTAANGFFAVTKISDDTFDLQGSTFAGTYDADGGGKWYKQYQTIYLTPYYGNVVALFNGTTWDAKTLAEISLSVTGLTTATLYDIFLYDNAGTLTLEAVSRASTSTAAAVSYQDGIPCKTGTLANRFVGTIYPITAAGTVSIELSEGRLHVVNIYNVMKQRILRDACRYYASYTYGTDAYRLPNGVTTEGPASTISAVSPLGTNFIHLETSVQSTGNGGGAAISNFGRDYTINSATGLTPIGRPARADLATGNNILLSSTIDEPVPFGRLIYHQLETGNGVGTPTWGNNARAYLNSIFGYMDQ